MANGIGRIFLRKSVGQIQSEHEHGELKRSLGAINLVLLGIGSSGRDDRVFPDPDRFDVGRDTTESIAFGRGPTPREVELSSAFLQRQSALHQSGGNADADRTALVDFCQALFSANEFIYVP